MPVIRRQQVCPLGISVGVQVRDAPVRLAADVPHRVVGVAIQRRSAAVFHRRELVLPVIGVAQHTAACGRRLRRDVAPCVICVLVPGYEVGGRADSVVIVFYLIRPLLYLHYT